MQSKKQTNKKMHLAETENFCKNVKSLLLLLINFDQCNAYFLSKIIISLIKKNLNHNF